MARIANVKGEIVTSGLHPATGNSQIPLWKSGSNVVFKDGAVKPGPQQTLIFNKGSGLLGNGIRSIDNQGSPALIWGDKEKLYRGLSPPTGIDVTRANNLINDLDTDSGNWTGIDTTVSDGSIVLPSGDAGSLKCVGTSVASRYHVWRDLAAGASDFTNNPFSVWLFMDQSSFNKLSILGDALAIRISSDVGPLSTNYLEFFLSRSIVTAHSTWVQLVLDLDKETADTIGGTGADTDNILSVAFIITVTGLLTASDAIYFDEMEFSARYKGTDLDRWSIVQFGQSVLASNGIDEVQYLADITTGLFINLSTAGGDLATSFRAKILQKLGPFIIAFNTDNDNTEARWCTEDNVLVWTPIASNSARDINLRDMNSSIKCVIEFGNSLLVVGETRAHIFQFLGAPFFFGAQKLIDGIGAVSKNAVAESGKMIFGFSAHGIYVTDGMTKNYIDEPAIHSFIYEKDNKYDITRAELVCVWEDTNDDEWYFSYPTVDGSGFTVSFNQKLKVWSMHDYWRTAASPGELWKASVFLSEDGDVFIQDITGSGSTADINPVGLSDGLELKIGYGDAAMGQQPYGGLGVLD
ncbi:hypothetical protein LCGC14_0484080 [marine sediment metagenome]|uniref:Uncharacterized protein n=1 Tax=marine sediment metagenome TaxID=412755 RepID=A0A0F9SRW8_9ZZZZ